MPQINKGRLLRLTHLLPLLAVAFGLQSCGHVEAAPPAVPMEVVMQTVRSYGSGHHGTSAPAISGLPDTSEATYVNHVHSLLDEANYKELESLARSNRLERGRFVAGDWRNNSFFNGVVLVAPGATPKDADYQQQIEKLKKWQAARPDSAAAKIAIAKLYVYYANFARGTGYADSVSDKQWRQYNVRTALAKQALLEAAALKDRDSHWYLVMQDIAHNEGWEKADARELLDQALAFEPDYFHFYRLYSTYLLPQWYGEPGEIAAFAKQVAAQHPEPAGSILYFQIVSTLSCYCDRDMKELKATADWQLLQLGFANLQAAYGLSDLNANRFAAMATVFGDKPVAREAFTHVGQRNTAVWITEDSFEWAKSWANSSGNQ